MQLEHVLCPVDFSESTTVGVRTGLSLARRFGARVTLLHVLPGLQSPFRVPVDAEDLYDQWDREAHERLDVVVQQARAAGIAAKAQLTRGSAVHEIAGAAREGEAGLIVVPTHSRAGLDRLLYGSVAERVVRVADVPVLTVPPSLDPDAEFAPRSILVATDFSPAAEGAFRTAVEAAQSFNASLVLAHVFTFEHVSDEGTDWWRPTLTHDQVETSVKLVTSKLDRLADRARRLGLEVTTDLSQGSNPAAEIVRLAQEDAVEMVVAAKHGGFLRHLLLGSTAEKLVRSCPVPLLTVPPVTDEPADATLPDPVPA